MRKYGKWLLVLGVLAANPAWSNADGLLSGLRSGGSTSQAVQKEQNQRKAEEVGYALRQAQLNGYDLEVEVRGDTVKLEGKVRDVTHRALAEQSCQRVPGITRVLNNLKYVPSGGIQQTFGQYVDSSVRFATYETEVGGSNGIEQVRFQKPGKRTPTPQPQQQQVRRVVQQAPAQQAPVRQTQEPSLAPSAIDFATMPPAAAAAAPAAPAAPPAPAAAAAPAPAPAPAPAVKVVEVALPVVKEAPEESVFFVVPATKSAVTKSAVTKTAVALPAAKTPVAPQRNNQEVAQGIANGLAQVGLVGYDVEIRYDQGVATLAGDVSNETQRQAAEFAASRTEGVTQVRNLLKVQGPVAQTAFAPQGQRTVHPASMTMPPAMMMNGGMQGAMPVGAPTPMGAAGNYSNPQMPDHAWPAYAQYPNSAAVQYPTQYSASAFPYIGPFYPYPQVPLGWREVGLEWDDGYWQLNFEKKKDAWYWLFAPKNWK